MKLSDKILKKEEKATLELRMLYEQYGYKKYKMRKFEEYDFYLENKSFLTTENIITFTDLTGKLMALKPDVTLSIVKNTKYNTKEPQKVYYCENVYRTSQNKSEYKEIMQVGLEYIGEIDMYNIIEVINLAKKSLALVGENYILDISHMGFVTALLESENIGYGTREKLLTFIGEKNSHEIKKLCDEKNLASSFAEKLITVSSLYGSFEDVLPKAKSLISNDKMQIAYDELDALYSYLKAIGENNNLNLDFSIINDMSYYNGIIFQGFIENIPCSILSGGRYDNLIQKFGKNEGAIGFAVYFDIISMYDTSSQPYDIDALIIYDDNADTLSLIKEVKKLTDNGTSVRVEKYNTGKIKYKELYKFSEGRLIKND